MIYWDTYDGHQIQGFFASW